MTALFECNPQVHDRPLFRVQIVTCDEATGLFVPKDVSAYTTREIRVKGPDPLTTVVHVATFTTDGTDGLIEARANALELSLASKDWRLQGRVDGAPTEGPFSTEVFEFEVEANL